MFAFSANAAWWRVESGTTTVYSDAGQAPARDLARRLELARRVFATVAPASGLRLPAPLPVSAFVLGVDRFRAVRPSEATKGFYQSAPDRDYIVLGHGLGADPARVTFHEYTHLVLNHTTGPLPQWLEEGLAEFYSTVQARQNRIAFAIPIPEHLRLLAAVPWLPAEELTQVHKGSAHFADPRRAGVFYAQSWALVHMLRLQAPYRQGFGALLTALAAGEPQAAAFQRVLGTSLAQSIIDLQGYLAQGSLAVVEAAIESGPDAEAPAAASADLAGELAYAGLALQSGHPEVAAKVYRGIEKGPVTAQSAAALGFLALAQKRDSDAKAHFERALQFAGVEAQVPFEYAMLLRQQGGSPQTVERYLRRTIEIQPKHAEAHFLLGIAAANGNRHADALPHLEQALAVFPRQSYFWHALAISQHQLGRTAEARRAAERALDTASTPDQAEMARAALRLGQPAAPTVTSTKPDVVTPKSWQNPQGDAKVEGVLERIDCLGESARFHVRANGKPQAFWVEKPGEVLLKNLSSVTFEFRCGPQKPVPVAVEYRAAPDGARMTVGVVTGIEFR